MKIIWLLLIFFSSAICQSNHNSLIIDVVSGVESGWWVYNKGSTEESVSNNLGWDRTHHRVFLPLEIGIYYQIHRYKIGLGLNHSWFFENTMFSSKDSYFFPDRYPVSDNTIKILKLSLQGEFDLVQKQVFSLSPIIKFGFFKIDTNHPEKDNFGRKTSFAFGITNQIRLSKMDLILRPIFYLLTISPKVEKVYNEKHNIYSIGLNIGLRFPLF